MILARFGLLLCTLAPLALATGCGEATLGEPAPCVTPAPSPGGAPATSQARQYLSTVRFTIDTIKKLRADQRAAYPDRTFSRVSEFRTQYAAYADASVCAAIALRDLKPPAPALQAFDDTLDTAIDQFIDHMKFGREAVRKRNVTEYREWFDGVDAKIDAFPPVPATPGRGGGPP